MNTSGPLSPKLIAFTLAGLFATSLLGNLNLITPDMLGALGKWAPFVYGTVSVFLGAAVGWYVKDPLRQEALDKRNTDAQKLADNNAAVTTQAPLPAAPEPAIQTAPVTTVPPTPPAA